MPEAEAIFYDNQAPIYVNGKPLAPQSIVGSFQNVLGAKSVSTIERPPNVYDTDALKKHPAIIGEIKGKVKEICANEPTIRLDRGSDMGLQYNVKCQQKQQGGKRKTSRKRKASKKNSKKSRRKMTKRRKH